MDRGGERGNSSKDGQNMIRELTNRSPPAEPVDVPPAEYHIQLSNNKVKEVHTETEKWWMFRVAYGQNDKTFIEVSGQMDF